MNEIAPALADERREHNLGRILRDGAHLRAGLARVDQLLADGALASPVSVILVDLDGSAEVRRHGIEAKVQLVLAARDRIVGQLPDGAVVVDSGTRDETYVVLAGHELARAKAVADGVLEAVRGAPFTISGIDDPVSVTASLGVATAHGPIDRAELFARTAEAQHAAKQVRDAVRTVAAGPAETRRIQVPGVVADDLVAHGLSWADVASEGLDILETKRGGLWHWAVERQTAGAPPLDRELIDPGDAAVSDVRLFDLLLSSCLLESAADPGAGFTVTVGPTEEPPGPGTIELLPGERARSDSSVAADPATSIGSRLLLARLAAAGRHDLQPLEVEVPWSSAREARLAKLAAKHAMTSAELVAEAAVLTVDHTLASRGQQRSPRGGRP